MDQLFLLMLDNQLRKNIKFSEPIKTSKGQNLAFFNGLFYRFIQISCFRTDLYMST